MLRGVPSSSTGYGRAVRQRIQRRRRRYALLHRGSQRRERRSVRKRRATARRSREQEEGARSEKQEAHPGQERRPRRRFVFCFSPCSSLLASCSFFFPLLARS